jgi:hypothetical protein
VSDFVLIEENWLQKVFVRAWEPGDGLTCSHAKAAPRDLPCTEPVAVTVTEDKRETSRTGRWSRTDTRRLLCRNHAPGLARPSQIHADARKAALERLAVENWATYQRYVDEEIQSRRDQALVQAPPEIRRIVLGEDA